MQKRSNASYIYIIALVVVVALAYPSSVLAGITIDSFGNMIVTTEGAVLGWDSQIAQGRSNSAPSKTTEQTKAPEKKSENPSLQKTTTRQNRILVTPSDDLIKIIGKDKPLTLELEQQTGEIEETVDVDGIDVDDTNVDDATVIDDTNPEPEEIITDGITIEPSQQTDVISVRAKNNAAYVIRNRTAAKTSFPLQVNLNTNELIVTTPKGAKIVTVLPDKAVQNMLAANVLDQVGGKGGMLWLANQPTPFPIRDISEISATDEAEPVGTDSADPTDATTDPTDATADPTDATADPVENELTPTPIPSPEVEDETDLVVDLVESPNGVLSYKVEGLKTKKIFGLRSVELVRTAYISAETGELVYLEKSWFDRIVEFISTD